MTLTVHLVLVFHIFIAVAIMVMVCGHRGYGLWPSWLWFVAVMVMVFVRHGLWPSCYSLCRSHPSSYFYSCYLPTKCVESVIDTSYLMLIT